MNHVYNAMVEQNEDFVLFGNIFKKSEYFHISPKWVLNKKFMFGNIKLDGRIEVCLISDGLCRNNTMHFKLIIANALSNVTLDTELSRDLYRMHGQNNDFQKEFEDDIYNELFNDIKLRMAKEFYSCLSDYDKRDLLLTETEKMFNVNKHEFYHSLAQCNSYQYSGERKCILTK